MVRSHHSWQVLKHNLKWRNIPGSNQTPPFLEYTHCYAADITLIWTSVVETIRHPPADIIFGQQLIHCSLIFPFKLSSVSRTDSLEVCSIFQHKPNTAQYTLVSLVLRWIIQNHSLCNSFLSGAFIKVH